MPRATNFASCPPFPDHVKVADLCRISFSKLLDNDAPESDQLFHACRETGFFLLDLTGSDMGERMLDDAEQMFHLAENLFMLDQEELGKYPFLPDKGLVGYKRLGGTKLEDGNPDNIEFYGFGQDNILGNSTNHPKIILSNRQALRDMLRDAHRIVKHLLSHLDKHLCLAPGTLASMCRRDKPSQSMLRMLKAPPLKNGNHRTNLVGHTDIGAITMLFNVIGGLQILPPGLEYTEDNWAYIRPKPGCAIINLGDSMVQWSGGVLRSNIHRVATAPGRQAESPRYSLAYFLRPEATASMRRLHGDGVIQPFVDGEGEDDVSAKDWEKVRALEIVSGNGVPRSSGGLKA
ncbi:hypothetical protein ACLMJK_002814 [Lecanora helva]